MNDRITVEIMVYAYVHNYTKFILLIYLTMHHFSILGIRNTAYGNSIISPSLELK